MSKFTDALNEQLANEFAASQQYIAIAAFYDGDTLPQLAAHFYRQAVEERNHAMIIVQYLLDAQKPVTIPAVGAPKTEFADHLEPVRLALEQERTVTDQIEHLAHLARKEGDLVGRAVPGVVPQGAARGDELDVGPPHHRRAGVGVEHPPGGGLPRPAADR